MNLTLPARQALPRWALAGWLLALVAGWWLSAPFLNLVSHDGFLYVGIALSKLDPVAFGKDPFFDVHLQGDFSLFTPMLAWVIQQVGIPEGSLLVSVVGRLFWLVALLWLVWRLAQLGTTRSNWLLGLALALLLPAYYAGYRTFSYAEPMAAPRCWAEAGVLASLALHFSRRTAASWLMMVLALAIHPLMAAPGLLWLTCLQQTRVRHVLVALGGGLLLVGAWAHWGPLSNLMSTYDANWWSTVQTRNYYILPQTWEPAWFVKIGVWCLLLVQVAKAHPIVEIRRMARWLAVVAASLLAAWVLGSWTQNVLIVQLQVWRVLWLCQLLAPLLWASGLPSVRSWDARVLTHVLLILAAMVSGSVGTNLLIVPALLLQSRWGDALWKQAGVAKAAPWLAGLIVLSTLPARWELFGIYAHDNQLAQVPLATWAAVVAEPVFALPLMALLGGLLMWHWGQRLVAVLGLAGLLVACSSVVLNAQTANAPPPDLEAVRQLIPPTAVVQWDGGVANTWLYLRRSHYASDRQATGALFSREVAMEMARRLGRVRAAGLEQSDHGAVIDPAWPAEMDRLSRLQAVCEDPALDFLILNEGVPGADLRVPFPRSASGEISVLRCHPEASPAPAAGGSR